jgi:two-component system, OmpR family, alkaline phosphatase synthesis response regulator PhoP
MSRQRVLVVVDDPKTRALLALHLQGDGFEVLVAEDGVTALQIARDRQIDAVVLDQMLPRMDGLQISRMLRSQIQIPIVLITARSVEDDGLFGFDIAADDYVTKPFTPGEIASRLRALLRRAADDDLIEAGEVIVDRMRRQVHVSGAEVHLTPNEFLLLEVLARSVGRTFTRHELASRAFGDRYEGMDRTIDVHIMNLRKKLGTAGKSIETVFGIGYKFDKQSM